MSLQGPHRPLSVGSLKTKTVPAAPPTPPNTLAAAPRALSQTSCDACARAADGVQLNAASQENLPSSAAVDLLDAWLGPRPW